MIPGGQTVLIRSQSGSSLFPRPLFESGSAAWPSGPTTRPDLGFTQFTLMTGVQTRIGGTTGGTTGGTVTGGTVGVGGGRTTGGSGDDEGGDGAGVAGDGDAGAAGAEGDGDGAGAATGGLGDGRRTGGRGDVGGTVPPLFPGAPPLFPLVPPPPPLFPPLPEAVVSAGICRLGTSFGRSRAFRTAPRNARRQDGVARHTSSA